MKISHYNQIIAVSTLLIGSCIFGFIWSKYQNVEYQSRIHYQSSISLKSFQHFSTMFQIWLTTQDLFFSGKQTYLAQGIQQQTDILLKELNALLVIPQNQSKELNQLILMIQSNDKIIASLLTLNNPKDKKWHLAIESSDAITTDTIGLIEKLEKNYIAQEFKFTNKHKNAIHKLQAWVSALIAIYLLMIIFGTRWISKNIVKPLENITHIANKQLDTEEDIEFVQHHGPQEVIELSETIQNLTQHIKLEITKAELQRKNADEANKRISSIMNSVPTSIILVNETGVIKETNKAVNRLFEADDKDILNKKIGEFLPILAMVNGNFDKNSATKTMQEGILSSDIKKPYIEYSGCLVSIFGENHYLIAISDINDRKHDQLALSQLNQQLLHAEKMASIGQLAAGIAHEINNPIGYIQSNIEILTEYYEVIMAFKKLVIENKPFTEIETYYQEQDLDYIFNDIEAVIKSCQDGTGRVSQIIKDLGNYAHQDNEKMEPVNIDELINKSLVLVANELKYKVELITHLEASSVIFGYPQKLQQVFINLLVNASHAIQSSGKVWITSKLVDSEVNISIKDNGHGISSENMKKLFDPFFTTKPVGKGTGLGLHIVSSILEEHNGHITVSSTLGKGTEFTLHLPLTHS